MAEEIGLALDDLPGRGGRTSELGMDPGHVRFAHLGGSIHLARARVTIDAGIWGILMLWKPPASFSLV
jgi:hypothetical protein